MSLLFGYFGPESMLPMTSVVAAAAGVFLMFGRTTLGVLRRVLKLRSGSSASQPAHHIARPHFPVGVENRSMSETASD